MRHTFFSKKIQPLYGVIKNPAFITLFICLILLSFNLITTYKLRPFNSDDVFWQTILLHWHPFNGGTATLGNSSIYVDKIPFFDLFSHLFGASRKVLLIEAAIGALLGFTSLYLAGLYFLKKAGAKLSYLNLLPFVWLSSFGYSFIQLYLNTNWRGFQLGVSFAIFALIAAIWYGDIKLTTRRSKLILFAASIYSGLLIYSDPYFLYFTIGPLALLTIVLFIARIINKYQFLSVVIPIVSSLIFAKIFSAVFFASGIRTATDYPMQFIHFENLADGFNGSIHSILIIFGSDFFGLELKISTLVPLLNFLLLSFIVYRITSFILKNRRQQHKLSLETIWHLFFIGICFLVFASHSISTLGQGTFTYRYFLLLTLAFTLVFALTLSTMKNDTKKYTLAGLLIVASILNISFTASAQNAQRADVAENRANSLNFTVINLLKNKGYTKGYANYWDANISTYLAQGQLSFLPSVCNNHEAQKWHWLINDDAFDKKSSRSFYFLNPNVPAACQVQDIQQQFGKASEVIPINDKTIFLYDHDISPQLSNTKG